MLGVDKRPIASRFAAPGLVEQDAGAVWEICRAVIDGALAAAGRKVADPARVFAVTDHIVDTRPGRTDQTLMPGGGRIASW